jgi:hypothetical protein
VFQGPLTYVGHTGELSITQHVNANRVLVIALRDMPFSVHVSSGISMIHDSEPLEQRSRIFRIRFSDGPTLGCAISPSQGTGHDQNPSLTGSSV